ncbi:hypothetical protein OsJ_25117 [Oryza sativa Japonica Group]|uniref:Uncharacterized protein n=1 Tax=Oryza sativa subsp. japonica TaxID=39947 RepID=Q8H3A2_ORYSJ|nr:hypothetical protein OsJ_25117 [Oryza sativa Japonica Group]BAC16496.1 hypothetical protein [Oryza sativa Japonica Group]
MPPVTVVTATAAAAAECPATSPSPSSPPPLQPRPRSPRPMPQAVRHRSLQPPAPDVAGRDSTPSPASMTPSRCRTTLASTTTTRRRPPRRLHSRPRHPRGRTTASTTPQPPRPLPRQPTVAVDAATAVATVTAAVGSRRRRQLDLARDVIASSRIADVTTGSRGTSTTTPVVRPRLRARLPELAPAASPARSSPPKPTAKTRRRATRTPPSVVGGPDPGTTAPDLDAASRRRRHALSSYRADVPTVLTVNAGERAPPPPSLQPAAARLGNVLAC